MTETEYKYTEEYRDRYSLNQGEIYWISEAFKLYCDTARKELEGQERSIITADYIEQMFADITWKLTQWTE